MSSHPPPKRRHRLVFFAAVPMLAAALLLSWPLFRPSPRHCQPEHVQLLPSALLSGLTLGPLPTSAGLVVTSLRSGGRAEQLGIHVGDVVDAINGRRVDSMSNIRRSLRSGDERRVSVHLRRGMGGYGVKLDRMAQVCRDA